MADYSLLDELTASPTEPMAQAKRDYHLGVIKAALHKLKTSENPGYEAWKQVATAVNLMETLIKMGILADPDKLIEDAARGMNDAALRFLEMNKPLRFDGPGLTAVTNLLADYEEVIGQIPHRTMIKAYRKTQLELEKKYGQRKKNMKVKL